jgi:NAD+ kinase
VRRGARPVLLARLHRSEPNTGGLGTGAPFTDRLVVKFGLPVTGWRGRQQAGSGAVSGGEEASRANA